MEERLSRMPRPRRAIGGICAGVAYRLGLPTRNVRIAVVVAAIASGALLGAIYVVLWALMPAHKKVPDDYTARTGDE